MHFHMVNGATQIETSGNVFLTLQIYMHNLILDLLNKNLLVILMKVGLRPFAILTKNKEKYYK